MHTDSNGGARTSNPVESLPLGIMRRVRIGSPDGPIRIAHLEYVSGPKLKPRDYHWIIHNLCSFITPTGEDRGPHNAEEPIAHVGIKGQLTPIFVAGDHPNDQADKTHLTNQRKLQLSDSSVYPIRGDNGLPIWIEYGHDGRAFYYHSGKDQLIPVKDIKPAPCWGDDDY